MTTTSNNLEDTLDKILFEHRWRAIADFHEAKDGLIPETTKHQEEAKAALTAYIEKEVLAATVGELQSWIDLWYEQSREHTTARYGIGVKQLKARIAELKSSKNGGQ